MSKPVRSPFQVAVLFVTAALQTSSRRVSSFSSPLSLPNHLFRPSGAMQSHRHSYTVLRGLGGDDFPSLKLLTYQQKLYKCFADPELRDGQIRCALLAGYLPAFTDGLTPPSGVHRLNGLFQGERDWLYLPVALEGNHSAWRLLADSYLWRTTYCTSPKKTASTFL